VSESEIPSDGSRKMFLVSDSQTGGTLDLLALAHRRPEDVFRVEVKIPYSVVADEASVTSVKLYAASVDGDDVTEHLLSKLDIQDPAFAIPEEVEPSQEEARLISTCDLSNPELAVADITEFIKDNDNPTLAVNIVAVFEVEGTFASVLWCPGVGPTVHFSAAVTDLFSASYHDLDNTKAYLSASAVSRVTVDLHTDIATLELIADSTLIQDARHSSERQSSFVESFTIGSVDYGSEFYVRSKYGGASLDPYIVDSVTVPDPDPELPPTNVLISPEGDFTLTESLFAVPPPEMIQPTLNLSYGSVGDVARIRLAKTGFDPVTSDHYYSTEYDGPLATRTNHAMLRDQQGAPVMCVIPSPGSTDGIEVRIERFYNTGGSLYTDQYGTAEYTIVIAS